MKTHTSSSYACFACGKKFFDDLSLCAHINLHKGMNPYSCSFCGKELHTYLILGSMREHILDLYHSIVSSVSVISLIKVYLLSMRRGTRKSSGRNNFFVLGEERIS